MPIVKHMDTLTLNNDIAMPALGLGVFQTPPTETRAAVEAALATGYRHIDTAAAYGNDKQVGEAVHSSGLARDEVFLETKIWISDYGYEEALHGVEKAPSSSALLGAITATEVFLDQLRDGAEDRGGDIVNISSVAGRTARAGNGIYAATRWGLNGWSESLRQELLPGVGSP
jgi:NAD(P)-dependent dehydrogenase (short-subunit alcohol dehydrogenase family)